MPRPSIAGWFDSEIRVWRADTSKDALAVEDRLLVPLATVGAAINRSNTASATQAGGTAIVGTLRWYGLPTIDVRERDVCEIISGPDAGTTWEVDALPVRPRNHHTQVDCVEWHGTLTEPS